MRNNALFFTPGKTARLEESIPKKIWVHPDYFNKVISKTVEYIVNVGSDSNEIVTAIMSIPDFQQWDTQQKTCLWLALAFCHPELSDPLLCILIGLLTFDLQVGFQLAALLGRQSFWKCFCQDNCTAMGLDWAKIAEKANIWPENPLIPIVEAWAVKTAKPGHGKSILSSVTEADFDDTYTETQPSTPGLWK